MHPSVISDVSVHECAMEIHKGLLNNGVAPVPANILSCLKWQAWAGSMQPISCTCSIGKPIYSNPANMSGKIPILRRPGGQHGISCLANLNDHWANCRFFGLILIANRFVAVWSCQSPQSDSNTLLDHYWHPHQDALPWVVVWIYCLSQPCRVPVQTRGMPTARYHWQWLWSSRIGYHTLTSTWLLIPGLAQSEDGAQICASVSLSVQGGQYASSYRGCGEDIFINICEVLRYYNHGGSDR